MNEPRRRVAAAAVALILGALVACDLWVRGVRTWWDQHALTGSVVTNLLVLAVTALIVDEVVARRQRRQRAHSVAVQGLIVYSQARRAYDAVMAVGNGGSDDNAATEELRSFASMLLTASPSLFDDPEARSFLERVQRLSGSMFRAVSSSRDPDDTRVRQSLVTDMSELETAAQPLLARVSTADQSLFEATQESGNGADSEA